MEVTKLKLKCKKTSAIVYCELDKTDPTEEFCLIYKDGEKHIAGRIHVDNLDSRYEEMKE